MRIIDGNNSKYSVCLLLLSLVVLSVNGHQMTSLFDIASYQYLVLYIKLKFSYSILLKPKNTLDKVRVENCKDLFLGFSRISWFMETST